MKASRLTAVGLVAAAGLWIASGHFLPHESAESRAAVRSGDALLAPPVWQTGGHWLHPLGTDDLLNLRCRPTAFGRERRSEFPEAFKKLFKLGIVKAIRKTTYIQLFCHI